MDLYITYITPTSFFSQGYHTDRKQDDLMDAYRIYDLKGKFAEEKYYKLTMKLSLDCFDFFFLPCPVITIIQMYIRST